MSDYYEADLAEVHHRGFGSHADACAPGIMALLEPVRESGGRVVELGCGSGLLTRHLVDAGHRVVATDASPALLELARAYVPEVEELVRVTLPDDPVPAADAIVCVGHALNYLPDEAAIDAALTSAAHALLPGGVLALDLCDLSWNATRTDAPNFGAVEEDWAIVTRYETPAPNRFVRNITTFLPDADGSWRRADERHVNVLVDTGAAAALLVDNGVDATVRPAFGSEQLPAGLVAIVGHRKDAPRR